MWLPTLWLLYYHSPCVLGKRLGSWESTSNYVMVQLASLARHDMRWLVVSYIVIWNHHLSTDRFCVRTPGIICVRYPVRVSVKHSLPLKIRIATMFSVLTPVFLFKVSLLRVQNQILFVCKLHWGLGKLLSLFKKKHISQTKTSFCVNDWRIDQWPKNITRTICIFLWFWFCLSWRMS